MNEVTRTLNMKNQNAIRAEVLSNGYFVSTVCLSSDTKMFDSILGFFPLDDRADLSTPGDYETMVFPCDESGEVDTWTELDFERYSSEKQALEGHETIVEKWMNK